MEDLEYEFVTSAEPAVVYRAVASEAGHRAWWAMDCDVGDAMGSTCEMRFNKNGSLVLMKFRIDALHEDRCVRWTCTDNDNPAWKGSTLEWRIDEHDGKTRLRLVHAGFATGGPPYEGTKAGWPHFMTSLRNYVEGRGGSPLPGMP